MVQPWLSTGLAAGFSANAIAPRMMATAKHILVSVGTPVQLNDGSIRHVIATTNAPDGADVTVLTVDADLPAWSAVTPTTNWHPADAFFVGAGVVGGAEVRDGTDQLRGWFWAGNEGTLRWTHSSTRYAKSMLEQYEVGFDGEDGSFAMTNGDSGGGFYVMDANGKWALQGIGSGISAHNGTLDVNGSPASQFRPVTGATNVTYQSNQMTMPRAWLSSLMPQSGDLDFNGTVDFNDLAVFAQHYNQPGTWSLGDFTGDGLVDFNDLVGLAQHYSGPQSDLTTILGFTPSLVVPEPTTALLIGLPVAMSRRRRRAA